MRPLAGEGLGLSVRESSSQRYVMIHISSYYVCVVYSLPIVVNIVHIVHM